MNLDPIEEKIEDGSLLEVIGEPEDVLDFDAGLFPDHFEMIVVRRCDLSKLCCTKRVPKVRCGNSHCCGCYSKKFAKLRTKHATRKVAEEKQNLKKSFVATSCNFLFCFVLFHEQRQKNVELKEKSVLFEDK